MRRISACAWLTVTLYNNPGWTVSICSIRPALVTLIFLSNWYQLSWKSLVPEKHTKCLIVRALKSLAGRLLGLYRLLIWSDATVVGFDALYCVAIHVLNKKRKNCCLPYVIQSFFFMVSRIVLQLPMSELLTYLWWKWYSWLVFEHRPEIDRSLLSVNSCQLGWSQHQTEMCRQDKQTAKDRASQKIVTIRRSKSEVLFSYIKHKLEYYWSTVGFILILLPFQYCNSWSGTELLSKRWPWRLGETYIWNVLHTGRFEASIPFSLLCTCDGGVTGTTRAAHAIGSWAGECYPDPNRI